MSRTRVGIVSVRVRRRANSPRTCRRCQIRRLGKAIAQLDLGATGSFRLSRRQLSAASTSRATGTTNTALNATAKLLA